MKGENHLQRGIFVYGRGDSSTEGKGKIRLRRGRFIYRGEDSSTEARLFNGIFFRKSRILASMTDKGQRIRGGGREDRKQRSNGHKQ